MRMKIIVRYSIFFYLSICKLSLSKEKKRKEKKRKEKKRKEKKRKENKSEYLLWKDIKEEKYQNELL